MIIWLMPIVTTEANTPVNTVPKPLPGAPTYLDTKWSMVNFGDFPVKIVTKFSPTPPIFKDTSEPIMWAPEVMPVPNVAKPLLPPRDSNSIPTSTAQSNPLGVRYAWRPIPNFPTCAGTKGCMPIVECKSSVTNVDKPSVLWPHCPNIGGFVTPPLPHPLGVDMPTPPWAPSRVHPLWHRLKMEVLIVPKVPWDLARPRLRTRPLCTLVCFNPTYCNKPWPRQLQDHLWYPFTPTFCNN